MRKQHVDVCIRMQESASNTKGDALFDDDHFGERDDTVMVLLFT